MRQAGAPDHSKGSSKVRSTTVPGPHAPSRVLSWRVTWRHRLHAGLGRPAFALRSEAFSSATEAREGALRAAPMAWGGELRLQLSDNCGRISEVIASAYEIGRWRSADSLLPNACASRWRAQETMEATALSLHRQILELLVKAGKADLLSRADQRDLSRRMRELLLSGR